MSLEKISAQLSNINESKNSPVSLPPIEKWNPPYCGEIDIQVKANGDWFYGGTIFKRLPLVKLFASVMLRDEQPDSDDYFLITPVEKVKIEVEDAPFVLTQWAWQDTEKSVMTVMTNLEDEFVLDNNHPLTINSKGELYVTVRRNLQAKVHRNVYYQWADLAKEVVTDNGRQLIFTSAGYEFNLGVID